jgi:hypothetical protein
VSGCWITHTDSGETELDLVGQADGTVTGAEYWAGETLPVTAGNYDGSTLALTVQWPTYTCAFTFTSVSATQLSGTSRCLNTMQTMTADRTCAPKDAGP